ncbi:uncharacterized protein LOC125548788 isoform X1 [Triticum urartu]|uniref:uncharacterized protein LOC125548788 isoform X1 n=1 Tax=Triticum urartu TaxID=4572 RepID=UPI0020445904|nr:uncharacterized protein LOC125548788 isoform X1 [Triticum urartu]
MSHEKHRGETTIASLLHHKSRLPSVITMALLVLGVIILIVYFNNGSGTRRPRAPRRTSRAGAAGKKDVGEAFFVFMVSSARISSIKPHEQVCRCCKATGGRWKSLSESIMVYQLARVLLFATDAVSGTMTLSHTTCKLVDGLVSSGLIPARGSVLFSLSTKGTFFSHGWMGLHQFSISLGVSMLLMLVLMPCFLSCHVLILTGSIISHDCLLACLLYNLYC